MPRDSLEERKILRRQMGGQRDTIFLQDVPKDSLSSENALATVTGQHSPPQRRAARQAGACGYVLKENLMAIRELLLETGQ